MSLLFFFVIKVVFESKPVALGEQRREMPRGLRFREHRMQKSAAACSLRWGEPPSVYVSCAAFVAEGAARERPGLQPRDRFQERRHNKSTECKKKRRKNFKKVQNLRKKE